MGPNRTECAALGVPALVRSIFVPDSFLSLPNCCSRRNYLKLPEITAKNEYLPRSPAVALPPVCRNQDTIALTENTEDYE